MIIRLTMIILIMSAFAIKGYSYQFYDFHKKYPKISKESFRRYIKPQCKNIIQEYFHIVKKLSPVSSELISIKNDILNLNVIWKNWTKECYEFSDHCLEKLKKPYRKSQVAEKKILTLLLELNSFNLKTSGDVDSSIMLINELTTMSQTLYSILHNYEDFFVSVHAKKSFNKNRSHLFTKNYHGLLLRAERIITYQLDSQIRKTFNTVWIDYILILEKYLTYNENQKYLYLKMDRLNITWNTFHRNITKGKIKLPKSMLTTIQVMHNRWNSILKMVLRNY